MTSFTPSYNIVAFDCGLISPEASGWFRKEIKTPDDLKGLKMRFLGLGANVMQKLGVQTQLLQAGEIFQALQLGTIDATEFSMPAMDYTLGFHQVAKHYYFPGWHQMSTINSLFVSEAKWAEMSDTQKDRSRVTCDPHHAAPVRRRRGRSVQGHGRDQGQGRDTSTTGPRKCSTCIARPGTRSPRSRPRRAPSSRRPGTATPEFRDDYKIWKQSRLPEG